MNDQIQEKFLKKMDKLFKIWKKEKEKEVNKKIVIINFLKNLNSEETGYFIKFCEEGNKFSEIVDNAKSQLKEANIKTSYKNTLKVLENELYGYDAKDLKEIKE